MNEVQNMNMTKFANRKVFYNFYSIHFSEGPSPSKEIKVQSFHEVKSYRLGRYIIKYNV